MASAEEGTFTTRDGTNLYTKTWKPRDASGGHLIFVHGFSDHINAYYNLFPTLSAPPYNVTVHGFDQRGWGRSAPKKSDWGLTGDTHQVLSDINDFISHVSRSIHAEDKTTKLFLMGHSMGAAESLMYMLADEKTFSPSSSATSLPISGLLVESPHIGFPPASKPNGFVVFAGRLAARILPNFPMVQKLEPSYMCRDPKVCKDWAEDPLCHNTGTLQGLAGLLDRANCLDSFAKSPGNKPYPGLRQALPCPVWWAHGTADKVCDFSASRKLFDKLVANGDGTGSARQSRFIAYEGGYHKLHAEPDGMGNQFAKDAGDWILQIVGLGKGNSTSQAPATGDAMPATAGTESMVGDGADAEGVKSKL